MALPTPTYRAGQQYPMFQPPGRTPGISGGVSNIVPNFNRLNQGASGFVQNLMSGLPSAAPTQRANAYFGAASGMPGSDFVRNRGFDLYGEKADAYQQRGFDDFLKMLQGYSGTVMPTTGEQLQSQEFNANLANRQREFDTNQALDQQQQAFTEMRAGRGVPWGSTTRGRVTDRFGGDLGYQSPLDRLRQLGTGA